MTIAITSPGGTLRINGEELDIAEYPAATPTNGQYNLSSPPSQFSLDLSSPSPDATPLANVSADEVNGVAQKIIKDDGKKEAGPIRSEECPTVRNIRKGGFDFPIFKIAGVHKYLLDDDVLPADRNVSTKVAQLQRMKEGKLLDAEKMFLYDTD